jgi:hypothetical protein
MPANRDLQKTSFLYCLLFELLFTFLCALAPLRELFPLRMKNAADL